MLRSQYTYYVIILGGMGGPGRWLSWLGRGGPELGKHWLRNVWTLPKEAFKWNAIHFGRESHQKKDHKRWQRGGGHQKITEDHGHRGGGCKKIGQTEGAQEGNNYLQDQLSKSGSKDNIFKDHRPISTYSGKLLERVIYFGRWFDTLFDTGK